MPRFFCGICFAGSLLLAGCDRTKAPSEGDPGSDLRAGATTHPAGAEPARLTRAASRPRPELATPVVLEDVTRAVGLASQTAPLERPAALLWLDYDADGDADLYAAGGVQARAPKAGRLLRHDRLATAPDREISFRFVEVTEQAGLRPFVGVTGAASADWDSDGDQDLILSGPYGTSALENTSGGFANYRDELGVQLPAATGQPSFEDLDGDGDADLVIPGVIKPASGAPAVAVFRNRSSRRGGGADAPTQAGSSNTAGRFESALASWAIGAQLANAAGVLWTDYDADADPDAVVFGGFEPGMALFENRRETGFAPAVPGVLGEFSAGRIRGVVLGDVDRNGRLDLIVTRAAAPVLEVLLNRDGYFVRDENAVPALGSDAESATQSAAADMDNDGDLDILLLVMKANRFQPKLLLLTNDGQGRYSFDAGMGAWPLSSPGVIVAPADADGDGRLDVAIRTADARVHLFRNASPQARPAR